MPNIIPTNISVPAHLAGKIGQPSALSQSISAGISSGQAFPRISIKGARFRIVEDGTETVLPSTVLDVVIVGANPKLSKTYYAKAWTPDSEPASPDCYSLDGTRPHPESAAPQNDLCATCPHNVWGSKIGPQGQQLKACTDQKRLAIVSADDPTGPIYLLQVTPAALKGLNAYHKELAARGIPAEVVRTKVDFDTDASFPKLRFGFGGFLDEDTYAAVENLFGSEEVLEITGERQPEVVATPSTPRKQVVSAQPAPAPAPAPEPPKAEAPKRGFGAAKAAEPAPAPAAAKVTRSGKAAAAPAPAPAPAPAADSDVAGLADEIANLLGALDD
jgi:hypothetical protein